MTKPVPCPPAPGPLEEYAARFDDLFTRVAQRRGFREYLAGLLAPRDRNKTLTALAARGPAPPPCGVWWWGVWVRPGSARCPYTTLFRAWPWQVLPGWPPARP